MLSNPFRRRARDAVAAPKPLDLTPDDDLDIDPPDLEANAAFDATGAAIEDAKAARKRDAADLAGGEARLAEIVNFAETNYLPEPAKVELRKHKQRFDDAIDAGPMDQAVRPLREMEKRAREAKGAALSAPKQPDPHKTAHLPYLDPAQLVADMRRAGAGGRAGRSSRAVRSIEDLQFMIDTDGSIYINDIVKIVENEPLSPPNQKIFEQLIAAAEQNVSKGAKQ